MIILLLTAPLALIVIGPFGTYLNDLVAAGAEFINGKASWLIPLLMGAFQPSLVVTGTAWAMTPIATMQLTNNGSEMINGPGMLASNIAQGAATLCVAVKSKNKNLKQLAASAGTTALLGITEPSLYGVTLKLKKSLIMAMIGGGCAGIYAGFSGLVRYAFVSPGLATLPAFIGKNPMNIIHALITCLIAFVVTFVLTWVLDFEDPIDKESIKTSIVNKKETTISDTNIIEIASPLSGELIPLSQVNDDVFSGELLGKGIAILPNNGNELSPIEGIISTVLESKHAVALQGDNEVEILIHIGLDTVNLEGKYFKSFVKSGDRVKIGDKLIEFHINEIKKLGYDTVTAVIICNSDKYETIVGEKENEVTFGNSIIKIK